MAVDSPVNEAGGPGAPPVVLDTTLYDLLSADQPPDEPLESFCMIKPNSDKSYGTAVPLSDKYIIHSSQADDEMTLAHMQLENCSHLLTFFSGPMNVIFLGSEGKTEDRTLFRDEVDANAKRSFAVINEEQRPKIKTYANVEDLLKNHDGSKIRWGFACDFAEQLPCVHHPELVYELNSKRWLGVTTSLRSANDDVLDCRINCPTHQRNEIDGQKSWYHGGSKCDRCVAGVEAEIERIRSVLKTASIPFVLKLTQSLSSVGTLIVQDEEQRKNVVETITTYLKDYLPRTTEENAHLLTTSIIHSDFIPGDTAALNFHVNRDGSVVFLGACHQLSTGESGRQATTINYPEQEVLEQKYRSTLDAIGKALNLKGYHGPVGADIMEDPDDGRLFAIDLNVRVPLSLLLYLLRGHFTSRGYDQAQVFECTILKISREEFEEKFAKEFQEAKIVLLGSTRLGDKEKWAYGMVVAAENLDAISALADKIFEYEAS